MYRVKTGAISDLGLKRTINEDSYCVSHDKNLFVVADGMGGHAAGEFASRLATNAIENFIDMTSKDENVTWPFGLNENLSLEANKLITAIRVANRTIYENVNRQQQPQGMGSTMVAILLKDDLAYIAHVGDSRAYRIRRGEIKQLTRDHSWVSEQLQKRVISEEQARRHQWKNIITRALGSKPDVEVDLRTEKIESSDYLILCSDGLSGLVEAEDIKDIILNAKGDPSVACQNLVRAANEKGGTDNITVIALYFEEAPDKQGKT